MNIILKAKQAAEFFFYAVLRYALRDCDSVLDVGCGTNSALQFVPGPKVKEGIDAYKKSIEISKAKHIHSRYTLGDIRRLSSYYKPKSFDAVICIDVIEHITSADGKKLIKMMENIAKKRVIILTPNGFYHQHELEGNPYQVHKSGWKSADFKVLGYRVFGLRGLRQLRDDHASVKYRPWFIWGMLTFLSEIIFFPFPDMSFDILAVKNTGL